ncbi:MAG: YitT family protein [Clostridia bacterium]|nr:YitT family protein [Clostridia bacterium]
MKKDAVKNAVRLIFGSAFAAAGMAFFLVPARLSAGGIGTLGTVFFYLLGIPLSLTTVFLNAILLFFGLKILGKGATIRTLAGIGLFSVFLELFALFPTFSGEDIISSVCGGCLAGMGVGLTLRADGSTGGSDLAGLILKKKFPHIPTTTLILFLDCAVIAFSGAVFRSFTVAFFSALAMYFSALVGGAVLEMGDRAKTLLIISEKTEEIAHALMHSFQRGVTKFSCRGGWEDKERTLLLSAVSPKEAPLVIDAVKEKDPKSFVILFDAREVLGEGFKPLP